MIGLERRRKDLRDNDQRPCYQVQLRGHGRRCSHCGEISDVVHIPTAHIGYFCRKCCPESSPTGERNMKLHPLPPDAKCPYCRKGGLAFVRQRGLQGDLYCCTATTPCKGLSLHYRRDRGPCGVSAEPTSGHRLNWTECPGREMAPQGEMTEEHLTTRKGAERLRSLPENGHWPLD